MTTKMTQADFDAMFEAAAAAGLVADVVHDPRAAKVQRDQDTARLSVEAEEERREPSLGEKATAAATGVAESATAGLSPYSWGAMKALAGGDYFTALPIGEIPKRFREGVTEQKESIDFATEGKRQAAFGAGHLAADVGTAVSGIAAPVKGAVTAGKAIAGGAPASSVLKTGMRPIIDKVRGALAEPLTAMGSRADELRALTPMGAHGGSIAKPAILDEAKRMPGGIPAFAQWLRDTGVSSGITTPGAIAKKSAALLEKSGARIGQMIDEASNAGGFVDTKALATRMRAEAIQAEAEAGMTGTVDRTLADDVNMHAKKLREMADWFDEASPGGVMPIGNVKNISNAISEQASNAYKRIASDKNVAGEGRALMDTRRLAEGEVGETIEGLGIGKDAYKGAKKDFQGSLITNEAVEASLGRAGKNNLIGLTDAALAGVNPPLAIARRVLKPFGSSVRATAAETARSLGKAVAPALTSVQTATVQRALASGQTPQAISQAMQLPLDAIEALAIGTAVKPSSAFALGKSALAGQAEGDRLDAMKKRLAAP